MIQEYTAQWGMLVEPKIEWKEKQVVKTNIIGIEPFLQLVDADKLKQEDTYKDKSLSSYLSNSIYASLLSFSGMGNYFEITNLANELNNYASRFEPHEETRQVILEKGTQILEKLRRETGFIDYFTTPDFVKEYKKEGQSIKGAAKLIERYGKKGINTLFSRV